MKKSLRARRMEKHHRRMKTQTKLNLVSLMDIFTILVFFLLVNSSDVEILQTDKTITLPESVASQKPDNTLVIKVNADDIVVGSVSVARVRDILAVDNDTIAELVKELTYRASRKPLTALEEEKGRAVTIMGDKNVPYELLKRIMTTCAANEYRNISLAVSQIAEDSADGPSAGVVN